MMLDVFAFLVFGILFAAVVAAIVALGSLPGKIARRRRHRQADAINAASWIGIATLGILWPIAFVWAFLRPSNDAMDETDLSGQLAEIQARLAIVEQAVDKLPHQTESD
jgi:hypothetical protein